MARVLVVGGSLGGLFAANVLHRDGHDVTVLEKVRGSMNGRGAGIVSHDALEAALGRAGLQADASLGVEVPGRVMLRGDGAVDALLDMPQILTSWSRLYHLLLAAFPADRYLQGAAVTQVSDDAHGVTVEAEREGRQERWQGDLLVASDGIRSTVRQRYFPQALPRYAGYVAWRGVCDEAVLSQHTLGTLFPRFGFCMTDTEQIIGYPVAGPGNDLAPGRRAYNFVWYRPVPDGEALTKLMTDADGVHHPQGIPPHKVSWRHIAQARQDAHRWLAPQFAEVIEKTAQPFFQPIFDLRSEHLCMDRVALMGDAAFVARPHIGMGVTKAAEDAVALADALKRHGATREALRAYEGARLPAGRQAVARARWLGEYMEQASHPILQLGDTSPGVAERAHQALHETAIDLGRYGHLSAFRASPA
jgi:2-polyprenyl-6-methoxyphenol hydroxylase-like FAD-dependent oxidoreductase